MNRLDGLDIRTTSSNASFGKRRRGVRAADIVPAKTEFDERSPVFERTFVFTGALRSLRRRDAMQCVVDMGGMCEDRVTLKTNYLVLGNIQKSIKKKKAGRYIARGVKIQIITEDAFCEMVRRPLQISFFWVLERGSE